MSENIEGRRVKLITRRHSYGVVLRDSPDWVVVELDDGELLQTPRLNVKLAA